MTYTIRSCHLFYFMTLQNFDFTIVVLNDYTIEVVDISKPLSIGQPLTINSMTLDIVSPKVNTSILGLDIKSYIYTYKKDRVLYTITGDTLYNIANQPIKDGVYTLRITINNVQTVEHKFVLYNTILKSVVKLMQDTDYNVTISKNDIDYTGDEAKGDVLKIRLATTLMEQLRINSAESNEAEVNNTIDKLNRLLQII